MPDIIQPRVLKGFRDLLPEAEMERAALIETLNASFRSMGFVPIDTPALEYSEILLGKAGGETEKQVYRFTDNGGRDVALRFDLTVPLARFVAEHSNELTMPFRRYHMAKVWRGENTQRGRYREFMQCDFDIVGVDSASADFDIIATIDTAMKALRIPEVIICINNRGVFSRFLERLGIADTSIELLRIVDKLPKIGIAETKRLVCEIAGQSAADELMEFIRDDASIQETLDRITQLAGGANPDSDRLYQVFEMADACGIIDSLRLSPNITRGLDYYTGIVAETFIQGLSDIGSICSGGRYNNLASLYTKLNLPGVGASIGLDRLLTALEILGKARKEKGYTKVLISNIDAVLCGDYQALAAVLRQEGIACEVFPDQRKLGLQYAYAEEKGARFAITRGSEEKSKNSWVVRDLTSRTNAEYRDTAAVIKAVQIT